MLRLIASLICCAGCSVLEQYDDSGLVSRSFGLGFPSVPSCRGEAERTSLSTFGLAIDREAASLGYMTSERTCLPVNQCSAIFFPRNSGEVAEIKRLFPDVADSCIIAEASSAQS